MTLASPVAHPRWAVHRRMYDWVLRWSAHPRAGLALFLLAMAEASVFPVPPDVLLIAVVLARPARRYLTAFVCTAGSVIGGLLGYSIGLGLWSAVHDWMFRYMSPIGFTPENFERVQRAYQDNAFLAVFTSGFTPIPYKVFTIAAGVFEIGLPVFFVASLLGRAGRFFLVAELVGRLGPRVLPFIEKYLGWLTLAFAALLILGFWALKLAG